MSSYKVSVSGDKILVNTTSTSYTTRVAPVEYSVALSRTGSQGSKGDSITNITLDSTTDELIFEITDSAGNISEINAGSIAASLDFDDLNDVDATTIADGQIVIYQSSTQTYIPHTLTTTSLTDVDNTGKADGALFIYDGISAKYKATTKVENQDTQVIGGTF